MDGFCVPSLRERKKAQTRRLIQEQALRLFLEKGYDATTVGEIAAAAGVSQMTFFRYFPTKEDVVLVDDYDQLFAGLIRSRPASEPAIERVRGAILDGFRRIYEAERDALLVRTRLLLSTPQLRARQWEQQLTTEQLIVDALSSDNDDEGHLRAHVVALTCLAVVTAASLIWVEGDGAQNLPDLVDQGFSALRQELGGANG